jgi:hypothetical protein
MSLFSSWFVLGRPLALRLGGWRNLLPDRPQERGHFSCNGRNRDGLELARHDQLAIARAKPDLALPGDLANRPWQAVQPRLDRRAYPGREAICPGAFDKDAAGSVVAGLGDPGALDPFARRAF